MKQEKNKILFLHDFSLNVSGEEDGWNISAIIALIQCSKNDYHTDFAGFLMNCENHGWTIGSPVGKMYEVVENTKQLWDSNFLFLK